MDAVAVNDSDWYLNAVTTPPDDEVVATDTTGYKLAVTDTARLRCRDISRLVCVGWLDGSRLGADVGWHDGRSVGCPDGCIAGIIDGCPDGCSVG